MKMADFSPAVSVPKGKSSIPFYKRVFKKVEPILYLLPAMSMLLLFTYYPFVKNTILSFFTLDKFRNIKAFAGLANYARVLADPKFIQAIGNTFIYVLATVPISIAIGLALSLLARTRRKTSTLYEAMYAMPMAVSASVIAMIFQLAFNPSLGIINKLFGLDIRWLTDQKTALLSLIIIQIWANIGYNFIFLFSALRGMSDEVLEGAKIDGATGPYLLFKIIIPLISPTMLFLLVKDVAFAMTTASFTLILTKGAPNGATETMMSYIYGKAITGTNYNAAFAATMVSFVLACLMLIVSFIIEKKGVSYD